MTARVDAQAASDLALIREALEYQERESSVGPLFPEAQDALNRLAARLEARTILDSAINGEGPRAALAAAAPSPADKEEA